VSTFARYGITATPDSWTKIRLLFEDPFYDVNYTLASTVALPLFAQLHTDRRNFTERYSRAISSGFEEPIDVWLRRTLDVDLRDPKLVPRALEALRPYIEELGR
jgi:oligoendopeptidase F